MDNAADSLHKIFEAWGDESWRAQSGLFPREVEHNNRRFLTRLFEPSAQPGIEPITSATANESFRAVFLVNTVAGLIDDLELSGQRVKSFRKALQVWARAVAGFPNAWHQDPVGEAALDALEYLSALLTRDTTSFDAPGLDRIEALLEEVQNLIREDESITDELRWYIHKHLQNVRNRIADYRNGYDKGLQSALQDLWVALVAGEEQSESMRERWSAFSRQLHVPVAAGILASLPTLAVTAYQLTQH